MDLAAFVAPDAPSVDSVLRRRGHLVLKVGDPCATLMPALAASPVGPAPGSAPLERYLDLFGKATFRKLARALIAAHGAAPPLEALERIAGDRTRVYLAFLVDLGALCAEPGGVRLVRPLDNLGPSVEWYVAALCARELHGTAAWGVHLEGLPVGGDYDVLVWLEPTLVYVEVKTSRPKDIADGELRQFLQRVEELGPEIAIFLVDTQDDLTPLLCRFTLAMHAVFEPDDPPPDLSRPEARFYIRPQAEYPGVSFGFRRVYVTNSQPSILRQLRRCLQHYHARVKGAPFYGGPGMVNFVTGRRNTPV